MLCAEIKIVADVYYIPANNLKRTDLVEYPFFTYSRKDLIQVDQVLHAWYADYTADDFRQDIQEVIEACFEESDAIMSGEDREATIDQIEGFIVPDVEFLLESLKAGIFPDTGNRHIMSAQISGENWGWDYLKVTGSSFFCGT